MMFGRFTYNTLAVGGGYEFINNNRQSTHFGAYYIFPNTLHRLGGTFGITNVKGCLVYAEHRFYFIKKNKVLAGPYVLAAIKGFYYDDYEFHSDYIIELVPSINIGMQTYLSWPRNISVDLSIGVGGFYTNEYNRIGGVRRVRTDFMVLPVINFNIGYVLNNKH